jgi:hypothetical protein
VAAALAAWLLLWQLADTRRQATAAEFQARIANAAFIGDRIAKLRRAVRLSLELRDQLSRLHPSLVKLGPFFLMLLDHQRPIGTETAEFLTLKSVIDELKTKADAFRAPTQRDCQDPLGNWPLKSVALASKLKS